MFQKYDFVDNDSIENLNIYKTPNIFVGKNNSGKSTLFKILRENKTEFYSGDEKINPIIIGVDNIDFNILNENKANNKLPDILNFNPSDERNEIHLSQLSSELSDKLKLETVVSEALKIDGEFEGVKLSESGSGINKIIYINWLVDKFDLIYTNRVNDVIKNLDIYEVMNNLLSKYFENHENILNQLINYSKLDYRERIGDGITILGFGYDALFDDDINFGPKKSKDGRIPGLNNDSINDVEGKNINMTISTKVDEFIKSNTIYKEDKQELSKIISILLQMYVDDKKIGTSQIIEVKDLFDKFEIDVDWPDKIMFMMIDEPENSMQESLQYEFFKMVENISSKLKKFDIRFIINTHSKNLMWLFREYIENVNIAFKEDKIVKYKNIFNNDFQAFLSIVQEDYKELKLTANGTNYNVDEKYLKYIITKQDSLRFLFNQDLLLVEGHRDKVVFEAMGDLAVPIDGFLNSIIYFNIMEQFNPHYTNVVLFMDYDISTNTGLIEDNNYKVINHLNNMHSFRNGKFKVYLSKQPDIMNFIEGTNSDDEKKIVENLDEIKNINIGNLCHGENHHCKPMITYDNYIKDKKPKMNDLFHSVSKLILNDEMIIRIQNNDFHDIKNEIFLSFKNEEIKLLKRVTKNNEYLAVEMNVDFDLNKAKVFFNRYMSDGKIWIYSEENSKSFELTSLENNFETLENINNNSKIITFDFNEEIEFCLKEEIQNYDTYNIKNEIINNFDKGIIFKKKQKIIELEEIINNNSYSLMSVIKEYLKNG